MSYYLLHRGWHDNPVFGKEPYCRRSAWTWLIENAGWAEQKVFVAGKVVTLVRGQLCHSLRFMAKAWGWDDAKVRRFLTRITTAKMIQCVTDAGQTVITICNYDNYQVVERVGDAPTDAATTQQRRSNDAKIKEPEEGKEKKEEDSRDLGERMASAWHETFAGTKVPLPKTLSPDRARLAGKALARHFGGSFDAYREHLAKIRGSPFLCGERGRWAASFDWALKPANITSISEGNYDDRGPNGYRPRGKESADEQRNRRRAGLAAALMAGGLEPGTPCAGDSPGDQFGDPAGGIILDASRPASGGNPARWDA